MYSNELSPEICPVPNCGDVITHDGYNCQCIGEWIVVEQHGKEFIGTFDGIFSDDLLITTENGQELGFDENTYTVKGLFDELQIAEDSTLSVITKDSQEIAA